MLQDIIKVLGFSTKKNNLTLKKGNWLLLLGIIINFNININSIHAQTNNNIAVDKNTINKPLIVRGTSGGAIAALEITQTKSTGTGYCDGFASQQPNHVLKIDTFFDYLRLEVESSADTTILVRGEGGVWCNDDAGSANPVIEGQWKPGIYQVWVGSYQANSNDNYKIKITGR